MAITVSIVLITAFRVLWNATLFFIHPFFVAVGNIVFDVNDHTAMRIFTEHSYEQYTTYDKTLDGLYYASAFVYLWRYRKTRHYFQWCIPFVAWRLLGNMLMVSHVMSRHVGVLVFPNVFGLLFPVYTALDLFGDRIMERVPARVGNYIKTNIKVINRAFVVFCVVERFVHEYIHHHVFLSKDNLERFCDCSGQRLQWYWMADQMLLAVLLVTLGYFLRPDYLRPTKKEMLIPDDEDIENIK